MTVISAGTSVSASWNASARAWLKPSAARKRSNASSASRRRPVARSVASASSPSSPTVEGTEVAVLIAGSFPDGVDRVRRCRIRPAPVSDLAWSPEQARTTSRAACVDLWTRAARAAARPAGDPRAHARRGRARRVALPVPEEPMPVDDLARPPARAHVRALAAHRPPRVLRLHLRRRHGARRGDRAARRRAQPVPRRLPARSRARRRSSCTSRAGSPARFGLPRGRRRDDHDRRRDGELRRAEVRARRAARARGARARRARRTARSRSTPPRRRTS